jgi:hypothetical protein
VSSAEWQAMDNLPTAVLYDMFRDAATTHLAPPTSPAATRPPHQRSENPWAWSDPSEAGSFSVIRAVESTDSRAAWQLWPSAWGPGVN